MKQLKLNDFGIKTPASALLRIYPIQLTQTKLNDFFFYELDLGIYLQDQKNRTTYLEDNF